MWWKSQSIEFDDQYEKIMQEERHRTKNGKKKKKLLAFDQIQSEIT